MKRFNRMMPLLILHRTAIEAALMKQGKGSYPPPHTVLDRLLEPVVLVEGFDDGIKRDIKFVDANKTKDLKDWSNIPLYYTEI